MCLSTQSVTWRVDRRECAAARQAGAVEQRMDLAADGSDAGLDRGGIAQVDLGERGEGKGAILVVDAVHFGALVEQDLGGRLAHAGKAAADDHPLAFVSQNVAHR
jgi:hypothetical protein